MAAHWRKSSFSDNNGGDNCVELAELDGNAIGVRDSKRPEQAPVLFTRSEIAAFVAGVKAGEFDDLC